MSDQINNPLEAREWLKTKMLAANRFNWPHEAMRFVDELYWSGAVEVTVSDSGKQWSENEPHADTLTVKLPTDPETRSRNFAIYNKEAKECHEDFGGEEPEYDVVTKEQAEAWGQPELEGEWIPRDEPLMDKGQETLTFWWD